jgi:hypothetical protein
MAKPEPISKKELKTSSIIIALIVGAFILSTLLLFTQYWFAWPIIIVCLLIAVGYSTASKHLYQCPSVHHTESPQVPTINCTSGNFSNALNALKEENATAHRTQNRRLKHVTINY